MQVRDEYRTDYDPDILSAFSLELMLIITYLVQTYKRCIYIKIMKSNIDSGFWIITCF